jgi:hypothetical protein
MRRRFPAVLASFFLAAVLAPVGVGLISDGPSVIAGKSTTVSDAKVLKSPTGTTTAGRRWN